VAPDYDQSSSAGTSPRQPQAFDETGVEEEEDLFGGGFSKVFYSFDHN